MQNWQFQGKKMIINRIHSIYILEDTNIGKFKQSKEKIVEKQKIRFFSKSSRLTHKTPLYPNKTNATLCNLVYANTNHSKFQEPKLGLRKISMDFRSLFSFQLQKKWFFWKCCVPFRWKSYPEINSWKLFQLECLF